MAALTCAAAMPVWSGVTLPNTRVIYPGGAAGHTVQVSNSGDTPYVVQLWADIDNPLSTPEQADAPFIITPVLFRIEPESGQSVRILFSGNANQLPQDKESIFYLNMVQLPPRNADVAASNQLKVIVRDRLKLFYRPPGLVGKPADLIKKLVFSFRAPDQLIVTNPGPWFASLARARVQIAGQSREIELDMVAPGASRSWTWALPVSALPLPLQFSLINDYGGITQAETTLNAALAEQPGAERADGK